MLLLNHKHRIDPVSMVCACGMTAEQYLNGELAHPGKPTSERLWELRKRLFFLKAD